jgi:putative hydrolase of the HAD superfamily
MFKAVFWDFGGVLTTSPFDTFNRFERENHLPVDFIRTINANNPDTNAWAKLERNEISLEEFDRLFERESRLAGHPISGLRVLELLAGDLRPDMVEVLRRCKRHFCTACLTNNMNFGDNTDNGFKSGRAKGFQEVMALFDYVIESSKLGIRKPDPRFYEMACEIVKVEPGQVVFLDDLGINLKPARTMGMTTIKVGEPDKAIDALQDVLKIALR